MNQTDTKVLIEDLGRRFVEAVPALKTLSIPVKLELQHRSDHQIYLVEFPGPTASKDLAINAKIELLIMRHDFNDMVAPKAGLKQWLEAFDAGKVKPGGDPGLLKLIANVIERQQRRTGG